MAGDPRRRAIAGDSGRAKPARAVPRACRSHYNTSLKKCLMLLEENQYVANQVATSATLIDTDDRYLYAFYLYV